MTTKTHTFKKLSAKAIAANTAILEDLYLNNADHILTWMGEEYGYQRQELNQMVDIAIAMLAQYDNTRHIWDIFVAEEMEDDSQGTLRRVSTEIYSLWIDKKALIADPANLLHAPAAGAHWKEGYNHALAQAIAKEGQLMSYKASYFSWADYTTNPNAVKTATVVALFDIEEDHWGEFQGTFNSEDDSHTGFTAKVILSNGFARRIRWETDIAEVMNKL